MRKQRFYSWVFVVVVVLGCIPLLAGIGTQKAYAANTVLWQMGAMNDSSNEFSDYNTLNPENVTVPSDWSTRTDWTILSKGMKKDKNPELNLSYSLGSIPANGVQLSFKVLDAYKSMPQMAVFSNNTMVGMIQIAGVNGSGSPYSYKQAYQLYIPKEFLIAGTNQLKLQVVRCDWCSSTEDPYLWYQWDYLKLESLGQAAAEPIHGKYIHLGTSVMEGHFGFNDKAIRHLPYVLKWLGIANSGNVIRTSFWSDITDWQPYAAQYLQKAKDYNMAVVTDNQNTQFSLNPDGTLPASVQTNMQNFFTSYGSMFQYYEVDNEPGLFNRSKEVDKAIARYVRQIKPANVKIVAPGWAYWPTGGTPAGWERDPVQRKEVEDLTDLTNGHSYGLTNVDTRGGSFTETLLTFSGVSPKEMLVTETGSTDTHQDDSAYGSNQLHASVFDRILRGHVGFADVFLQHAAFFNDGQSYAQFEGDFTWATHNPADTAVHPGVNGEDPRIKSYRRLALAYATHGQPLEYSYLNSAAVANKLVYFRAVNTSTLAPLPGSGAVSNKMLLNFVNFDQQTVTMNVQVKMPQSLEYQGERFGAGNTYDAAHSILTGLNAAPYLNLTETLGPGESVQYILEPKKTIAPAASSWTVATAGANKIRVGWLESDGATSYNVKRAPNSAGPFTTIASNVSKSFYTDQNLTNGTTYYYVVSATNAIGTSGDSPVSSATPTNTFTYEGEDGIGGLATSSSDSFASNGKYAGAMHNNGAYVKFDAIDGGDGGNATMTVRYATNNTGVLKSLYINGVNVQHLSFPSTGSWCCSSTSYLDLTMTVNLNAGMNNLIMIKNDGAADPGGVNIDKITITTPYVVTVDNTDSGFFSTTGTWGSSNVIAGYYGTDYLTDTTAGADVGKTAKWTPNITQAGTYQVYMRWTAYSNRPVAAPVTITYNGGSSTDTSKTVNQTLNNGIWVLIGTYPLAAGTGNSVMISAANSGYTIADAVKFVK